MGNAKRTFAFGVGDVLGHSLKIWLRNLLPFSVLATIVYAPLILYTLFVVNTEMTASGLQIFAIVGFAGSSLLGFIVTGGITYGVVRQLQGEPAPIGTCISVGLRRMFPILWVGILVGVIVFLGTLLLIIPGIIWLCTYYVAVPVAVIEKIGGSDSLRRSKELTRGNLGNIFAVVLLIGLLGVGVDFLVDRFVIGEVETVAQMHLSIALQLAQSILLAGTLGPAANALIYYELRRAKEGVSIDELAKVFE